MDGKDENENDEAAALFFNRIVPGLWVGLLDMIHDLWMRLGEFMEEQSKIYEEVVGTMNADNGEETDSNVFPFPNKKDTPDDSG